MTLKDLKNMTEKQRQELAHVKPMSEETRKMLSKMSDLEYDEKGIPRGNLTTEEEEEDSYDLDGMMYASDDVPWLRRGYPGHGDYESGKWGPSVSNIDPDWRNDKVGRIYTDAQILELSKKYCPRGFLRERAFAMYWDYNCNEHWRHEAVSNTSLQGMITCDRDRRLVELAMQSAIQWLGTNCGYGFMHSCERLAETEFARLFPAQAASRAEIKKESNIGELLCVEIPCEKSTKRHFPEVDSEGGAAEGSEEEAYIPMEAWGPEVVRAGGGEEDGGGAD